jgi:thiamine-phosphate pyrophosphorylase
MGLDTRLKLARLQLVTDTMGGGRRFGDFCTDVFRAGVDMLQVREPGLSPDRLTEALEVARSVALQLNRLVVVSEDVKVATAFGADVLQIDATTPAAPAKAAQHDYALVGVATHDEQGLEAAVADPHVAYLTVGPVFGPRQPRHRLPGLEFVRSAAERITVADAGSKPWFAIGGIDGRTLDEAVAAGARRVVVTRSVLGTEPAEDVRAIAERLRGAWLDDAALQDYGFRIFAPAQGQLKA